MFHVPHKYRERKNPYIGSDDTYGNNGFFVIPHPKIYKYYIQVQASDGASWEHASVSIASTVRKVERCPTWEEMCYIKNIFWDETDCVIQYHPPKSEYVNMHKYCLHLWRNTEIEIPVPQRELIGL